MCASQKLVVDKCDKCLSDIKTHTNDVMGMFEIHADNLFDNFNHTAKISLEAMEAQTNEMMIDHLKKQGVKHDEEFKSHLEIQTEKNDIKYNEYLDKKYKREDRQSYLLISVLLIFATALGYMYFQQNKDHDFAVGLKTDIDAKPTKKEATTLNVVMALTELGDAFNRKVYVQKDHILSVDTTAYFYLKKNIYGEYPISRSETPKFSKEYDPYKKEK